MLLLALNGVCLFGAEPDSQTVAPKFLGAQSCSSSSCHGGAGEISRQFTLWSQYDFHHHRPVATLATARSERLAEVLKLGNPTQSPRCTVCHAPFQTVPAERLGKDAKINEGVSCESCHGPAENWLRSHTRKDYTHEDRVHAGMRDLKNLYVRANTCVACHQNVDSDLLRAGHPELIFELDGQAVTQPKHWRESTNWNGAQTWLVGQAVALREMSWQLATETNPPASLTDRWAGLAWLVQRSSLADNVVNGPKPDAPAPTPETLKKFQADCNEVARDLGAADFRAEFRKRILARLADSSEDFVEKDASKSIQARRAERLVLALDRLTLALPAARTDAVNAALNRLFAAAQSLPDFDPTQFAKDLKEFHSRVSGALESK